MGGCATKPKVSKDSSQPLPEDPNHEDSSSSTVPTTNPRSLSFLFKENEDTKVAPEQGKTAVEETGKQEIEAEKPSEGPIIHEPTVRHEPPKAEEKPSEESKLSESAKQESAVVDIDINETAKTETSQAEKPSEESQISEQTEETVNPESEEEKPSEENNQSSEPLKEEHVETKELSSEDTQSNEPIKQELIETSEAEKASGESEQRDSKAEKSETINTGEVALPEEKVIEVVSADAESVQKVTEEATSNEEEEKSHVQVEHAAPRDAEVGTEIH